MPSYEMTGTVKTVFEAQTFPSGFSKREFVVTTDDRYPQDIKIECVKEWCALLDDIRPGDAVNVKFRLRGNAYNDRYYVNVQAFGIDKTGGVDAPPDGGDAEPGYAGDDLEPEDAVEMPF